MGEKGFIFNLDADLITTKKVYRNRFDKEKLFKYSIKLNKMLNYYFVDN